MLSELRTKKLIRWFRFYDHDCDGAVEKEDFEQTIALYVEGLGVQIGTSQYARVRDAEMEFWAKIRDVTDASDDGRVTLDEWLNGMDRLMTDNQEIFESLSRAAIDNLADALDADGDGKVTKEEYIRALNFDTQKTSARQFEEAFERMDVDKSGYLSRAELQQHWHDFCYSDDPETPGNWLMGPFN